MQLKNLFDDDAAVSPVIGVILMVAITVILAAVIGTFVLGLGDTIGENAPSATYDWDQSTNESGATIVDLTHQSGENVNGDRVTATVEGTTLESGDDENDFGTEWAGTDDRISSGDSIDIADAEDDGDVRPVDAEEELITAGNEIRVVWTASGGGSSSTLSTYTVN